MVLKIIKENTTKEIVIKMPHKAHSHKSIVILNKHIAKILAAQNVPIVYYTLEEIKAALKLGLVVSLGMRFEAGISASHPKG